MQMEQDAWRNRPVSDEEWRSLELKVERDAGFSNGALCVFTVMLMVGAFWAGLQTGPFL